MKLLVGGAVVGARYVVPLQLLNHRTVATRVERAMDIPGLRENFSENYGLERKPQKKALP